MARRLRSAATARASALVSSGELQDDERRVGNAKIVGELAA
jgi:hypothetical protein